MCVILAVHHPCMHDTSVWQHCINASRSTAQGVRPCDQVRHHPRSISTRKRCINCISARRAEISERAVASPFVEKEEQLNDDSGYHSGTIAEEEEEDDYESDISPKTSRRRQSIWYLQENDKALEGCLSEATPKVTHNPKRRKSSAQDPQRDVNVDSISVLQRSLLELQNLTTKNENTIFRDTRWSKLDTRASTVPAPLKPMIKTQRPVPQALNTKPTRPAPLRKASSLLHPSTPPAEKEVQQAFTLPFPNPAGAKAKISVPIRIPPAIVIQRPTMHRKRSTLLHPSTPPHLAPNHIDAQAFPFSIRRPPPIMLKLDIPRSKDKKPCIIHSSSESISQAGPELEPDSASDSESGDDSHTYDEVADGSTSGSGSGSAYHDVSYSAYSASIYSVTTNDDIGLAESARMLQAKRISQLVME
ncbi:hypothetical protein K491DRAFT_674987 [Lophiostoma macrostomum CBS 122681]|uniref:Uncharacterized protein n=1 Tax=Lophiostoma macrostomum CBS 122681 TaxID=1314788 RepID=A0A6A6TL88_9PLEO|nr:hypothetical protein K491DRAFT_674987 [Lophiostoma macrostomum CBS 122681]